MKSPITTLAMLVSLAAAAPTPAIADSGLPVTVRGGSSGELSGMHGGIPRLREGEGWLRCAVRRGTAHCHAVDAQGRYATCQTRDTAHLQTVATLETSSFVRVWFEHGRCTSFYVGQAGWARR